MCAPTNWRISASTRFRCIETYSCIADNYCSGEIRDRYYARVPSFFLPGNGTFLVPDEVKPGTYRTRVPADSVGCYWARLKGTSGSIEDVIASDIQDAGATVTVTVKATDKAFKIDNECGTWTKIK